MRRKRRRGSASGDATAGVVKSRVSDATPPVVAERVLRESYGRLVAILATRTRDVAAAEDALGDAFAAALATWPTNGVPTNPEAWLLTTSRNRLHDAWRHARLGAEISESLQALTDSFVDENPEMIFPDERLRLMFVCAHPAIEPTVRAPLMLQTVLGLDVARIAGAFMTSPATLGQRLVRAKRKIRDAGIPFTMPAAEDLPARVQDVLDGIYAAYGTGWDDVEGADHKTAGLTFEALQLGEAVVTLLPTHAEPIGLLALMLFCEARAGARRDAQGRYVPLSQQDTNRWELSWIARAEQLLLTSAGYHDLGPFQLEAAIQSAHCQGRLGAPVAPAHVLALYDGLMALQPSLGAAVSRASVISEVHGPQAALAALAELPASAVQGYQAYWAALAHLHSLIMDTTAAVAAFDRAIALAESTAVREYLLARRRTVADVKSPS